MMVCVVCLMMVCVVCLMMVCVVCLMMVCVVCFVAMLGGSADTLLVSQEMQSKTEALKYKQETLVKLNS
jgi:hypothetical protein